jgi:hypothetical protein
MAIPSEAQNPSCSPTPSVNLFRHDGTPRTRFTASERLIVLGGHEHELEVFCELLAPRRCPYISQRWRDGERQPWRTVDHSLTNDLIVRHLLANRLPGADTIWVGARAWEKTNFVAIDVDFRNDAQDFARRCDNVERALYVLGIPRESWLIQSTPSGGRHYFFFTYRSIPTWEVSLTLELVGLVHINGQQEVYPSETQGLRLPFGWIPGQAHDPESWLQFIRAYEAGEFPRVNWNRCKKRAERYAHRQAESIVRALASSAATHTSSAVLQPGKSLSPSPIGIPKPERANARQGGDVTARSLVRPSDIDALWQRVIVADGTRLDTTKKIAWNFIFVRGMLEEEAANEIIDWIYRTGNNSSKDVREDLLNNTRKVADQTRQVVAWYAARRREGGASGSRRFSHTEIDAIVALAASLPTTIQPGRIRFAIDFLNFAKRQGIRHGDGWACSPAVRGIIRKWKGCSGTRYKPHLDWALEVGLIEMVREKWQSRNGNGRARTYVIHALHGPLEEQALSHTEAIQYAGQRVLATSDDAQANRREGNAK